MKNPWEEIELSDYEEHMKLDSVKQLQCLNKIMKKQFNDFPVSTIMILGIAGGNGLEHIKEGDFKRVYGVDVNQEYLKMCKARYSKLDGILDCLHVNLIDKNISLPHADLVVANLLIEYIGYSAFNRVIEIVNPKYISTVIQINVGESFVSDSPYTSVFDKIDNVHWQMYEDRLTRLLKGSNYSIISKEEYSLPNDKKLLCLNYGK